MILLDQTVVAVATPQFQADLSASLNQVVWVTSIYLLTFAVPLLVTGRLGDRFGQRNVYLVGMTVFTLSSLACGLAPDIYTLIVARAFQGLGASIMAPQTMSVINRIFARDRRGAAMGVWGAVAGLASLAGPILGGVIVNSVGWQWIFFINVPLGVLSFIMVSLWVPTMARTARNIDGASVVVSILAMFGIVFAVQEGPERGWPLWIWGVLITGLLLIALFIRMQATANTRGNEALIPLEIFHIRNFSIGAFSIATMGFAISGIMLPIMIFLQQGHGLSAEKAGFVLVPMAVISGVLAPYVGRLSDKLNPRILSVTGFVCMTAAVVSLALVMRDGVGLWWIILPIVLLGFGNGFVWSPNSATAMRDLPITQVGAASGVYNTTRQVGAVVGAAVIGAAMQIGVASTSVSNAMGNSVIPAAVILFLGLIAVSRFHKTPPGQREKSTVTSSDD
ncbi:Multidrug resistance protein stp [Corynebacterium freiburgense]|nr:Multidrug resistance protein stp [Corynebacterium freiburgense]